jgi:mannose-6-phosphate isomerase-like protein (cupin superfamily)
VGDAIAIPPGAWHELRAGGDRPLRILCCCAPPYRHEDTFFE